jgi:uncharacterized protein (DUF169 family)
MKNIHHAFSNRFRSHFVKVKFYEMLPKQIDHAKKLKNVRFCEAAFEATRSPIILDKENINCIGAQYAFGWIDKAAFLEQCSEKSALPSEETIRALLDQTSHFKKGFDWIGLNTEDSPDLILAKVTPKQTMVLIDLYHRKTGKTLDVNLCGMMSICGGIAVKTFLENRITVSFGCRDSRKYAKIGREWLAVGIPKNQFDLINYQKGL